MSPIAPNQTNQDKNQGPKSPSQESSKPANPGQPETANQGPRSETDLNPAKDANNQKDANKTGANTEQKGVSDTNPESKDSRDATKNVSKAS